MKITILSGGSGNDSLIKGLKGLFSGVDVKVVVNAYDNGLSTGVCRQITNTLGVSDIRKNHIRMYKAMTPETNWDRRLIEFYENRYDLGEDPEATSLRLLKEWGLSRFSKYVTDFFRKAFYIIDTEETFKNFNVANIVLSELYSELGYEEANKMSCNLLGIDDFVVLNSFDNVYLNAITDDYRIITDEGDIVKLCDNARKIVDTFYIPVNIKPRLNPVAVDAIINCDMLLISTGTFWSSIYPTLQYGDMYKFINGSKAKKKIWAINNSEDKDAYGVTSNDFIQIVSNLGVDLSSFIILENLDASELLCQDNSSMNIVKKSMGNTNGKHDSQLFATELLKLYYGITSPCKYDYILFDFDDTLYSRDNSKRDYSNSNLALINKLKEKINVEIVSGNTYDSIREKLIPFFGLDQSKLPDIWADANSNLYKNDIIVESIEEHAISESDVKKIIDIIDIHEILKEKISYACYLASVVNIKFKPLSELERELLCDLINDHLNLDSAVAISTGKTTVDIVSKHNSKANTLKKLEGHKLLYVGDEIDKGNDSEIALACDSYIKVSGVEETNVFLRLLLESFEVYKND